MNRTTPPAEYNSRSDPDEDNKCHHKVKGAGDDSRPLRHAILRHLPNPK